MVKCLFTIRDYYFEILGATIVLASEMSTSDLRPWLENVAACFSSLMTALGGWLVFMCAHLASSIFSYFQNGTNSARSDSPRSQN